MIALWLAVVVILQGVPVVPETGKISGILRTAAGDPAANVRVVAAVCPDISSAAIILVRLTETDNIGRFILDDVPPGRYCLMAGAIGRPTFYPGTLDSTRGVVFTLGPKSFLTGMDFALDNSSSRPQSPENISHQPIRMNLPIQVAVEGENNQPTTADIQSTIIRLTSMQTGIVVDVLLSNKNILLPLKSDGTEEYQIRVEKLPPGLSVKYLAFNGKDLSTSSLQVSVESLLPSVPLQIVTFGGPGQTQTTVDRAIERLSGTRGLSVVLARTLH